MPVGSTILRNGETDVKKQVMPWLYNKSIIESIDPALRYDGSEGFAEWQARARAKLAELNDRVIHNQEGTQTCLSFSE